MMFRTHIVFSLLIALLIFPLFSLNKGIFLIVFLFAALLPDIDSAYSFIGGRVKLIGWVFRHRGLFHSFLMTALLSGIVYFFTNLVFAIVFVLGYISHLVLDMLNHEGIRPLYPFSFRLKGFIRTSSLAEYLLFTTCLIIGFCLLLR
jgi:inner membrane protein